MKSCAQWLLPPKWPGCSKCPKGLRCCRSTERPIPTATGPSKCGAACTVPTGTTIAPVSIEHRGRFRYSSRRYGSHDEGVPRVPEGKCLPRWHGPRRRVVAEYGWAEGG